MKNHRKLVSTTAKALAYLIPKDSQQYRPKPLRVTISIAALFCSLTPVAIGQTNIGDLSIYQPAAEAKTNLMMMIDTSGSMGISSLVLPKDNKFGSPGDVDIPLCKKDEKLERSSDGRRAIAEWRYDAPALKKSYKIANRTVTYYMRGCYNKNTDNQYINESGQPVKYKSQAAVVYDRLSRLKDAMIPLLAREYKVNDDIIMGLASFSSRTPYNVANTQNNLVDGHSGKILVAAAALDDAQRFELASRLAEIKSVDTFTNEKGQESGDRAMSSVSQPNEVKTSGGTPTAQAYAEVGAAMLGTTTGSVYELFGRPSYQTVDLVYDAVAILRNPRDNHQTYWICIKSSDGRASALGRSNNVVQCDNRWPRKDEYKLDYLDGTAGSSNGNKEVIIYDENDNRVVNFPRNLDALIDDYPSLANIRPMVIGWGKYEGMFYHSQENLWKIIKYLPEGWRIGGWRKVPHQPLDIEPVTGQVFSPFGGYGLFLYRTSPFRLESQGYWGKSVVNTVGGFDYSLEGKAGRRYEQVATDGQCDANGIFFMTDGAPNSTKPEIASQIMNLSLGKKGSFNALLTKVKLDQQLATGAITLEEYNSYLKSPDLPAGLFPGETGGWEYIGEYAKRLHNPAQNPAGVQIKTAVAGFGSVFNIPKNTDGSYDCLAAPTVDAKNACLWGSKNHDYGQGGFFYTQSSEDIANALTTFIASLDRTIDTLPSGTISVPEDPYQSSATLPYAYLPLLEPKVSENVKVWPGNLKKYRTKNGSLFGANAQHLFVDAKGNLNDRAIDLWTSKPASTNGNAQVQSGGFFAQLTAPHPGAVASTRNVFVENYNGRRGAKFASGLVKIGVGSNGHPDGSFPKLQDKAIENNPNHPRQDYGHLKLRRMLLNFLGYDIDVEETARTSKKDLKIGVVRLNMKNFLPPEPIRVLGGIIHSKPALVSYSAQVDENGVVQTTDRDDYLLFGSMDGALHLANAETGQEVWAIVFQEMLRNQAKALVKGSKGALEFGVDAPWLVDAKYNYNVTTSGSGDTETKDRKVSLFKPTASTDSALINTSNYVAMAAYGGFRMGGDGLYALDLTDKAQPKVLFRITPYLDTKSASDSTIVTKPVALQTNRSGTLTTSNDDYSNVGQIWNKVTMGRINPTSSATKKKDVIIFGGGYDMAYEDPTFVPRSAAKGSSIYIADAKTGEQIWKWDNPHYHSIVGGITKVDADADGLFDHLYFADLGGNVFRADFINRDNEGFSEVRVVRLFAASAQLPASKKHLAYRFYNRPAISVYEGHNNQFFVLINIASGDRSSPLSDIREDNDYANRVYGIMDSDIGRADIFNHQSGATSPYVEVSIKDLNEDDLVKLGASALANASATGADEALYGKYCSALTDSSGTTITLADGSLTYSDRCKKKVSLIEPLLNQSAHGWYQPLTRFAGFEGVKNIKAIGDYQVIDRHLFMSVYDPNASSSTAKSCDAQVLGSSEQQLYCLPFGICMDDSSVTGSGGFIAAGKGIQELSLGAVDSDKKRSKVLLGTQTFSQRLASQVGYGEDEKKGDNPSQDPKNPAYDDSGVTKIGGDGTMASIIFNERFILKPTQWYEAK